MNISGILVQTLPKHIEDVIKRIKDADCCEYHMHDDKGRIVVTIEGVNTEEEIKKLKTLKAFENIIAADMMYAFSDDELSGLREKLDSNDELPEWLNDPNAKIEDIKYNGDLSKKIF